MVLKQIGMKIFGNILTVYAAKALANRLCAPDTSGWQNQPVENHIADQVDE